MGGALVSEVRSAAVRRKILMIRLMGPTAQVIPGGFKQNLNTPYSLQNLNLKPVNLNPQPCTANTQH